MPRGPGPCRGILANRDIRPRPFAPALRTGRRAVHWPAADGRMPPRTCPAAFPRTSLRQSHVRLPLAAADTAAQRTNRLGRGVLMFAHYFYLPGQIAKCRHADAWAAERPRFAAAPGEKSVHLGKEQPFRGSKSDSFRRTAQVQRCVATPITPMQGKMSATPGFSCGIAPAGEQFPSGGAIILSEAGEVPVGAFIPRQRRRVMR